MNRLKYCFGLLALLLAACTSSEEDYTGSLAGHITDAVTGEAIQGVNVTITPGGLSRTTGSDGSYEFVGIDAVQYTVQAKKADYKDNTRTVTVRVGETASADMTLTPVKKLELSATMLNFGKTNNSLSFDILNQGTSKFNWNISGLGAVDWLEVNPGSGSLDGGKSCTVQVNVLRDKLTENAELTLMVNADKESVSLKVTVEVEKVNAKIEVDPAALDFGTEESVLTFNVKNVGNAGDVKWNITGLDVDWITIDPMEGTLGEGKTQAVKVSLARALVKEHVKTVVLVNAGGESISVEITADEKKTRSLAAEPVQVEFGEEKENISLTLTSYNGSTTYMLLKKEENVDWLSLSKTSGTIPQYDAANPAMKETIELTVSRKGLEAGTYNCTLIVRSDLDDFEIPVSMKVKEAPAREFKVQPSSISIGTAETASFTMFSNNGATAYQLLTKENIAWLSFSKTAGTVAENGSETIDLTVNRASLSAGDYNCTIIVRTDLGDTEIPVTMTVEEQPQQPTGDGTIVTCHSDLEFTLVSCKMAGSKAVIEYTVKNIGTSQHYLELYGSEYDVSLIYDDRGNEYNFRANGGATLQLGTNDSYYSVDATIPAGVLVKGSVTIPDVDDEAAMFKNITLKARVDSDNSLELVMKDIVIEGRTVTSLPAPTAEGTVQSCHDDLDFTLLTCKRGSSGTVTVAFRVKNTGKKTLYLELYGSEYSSSLIYDDLGNQYKFTAGNNGANLQLGTDKSYYSVNAYIPAEVVLNGSVIIPAVDASAQSFTNITIKALVGSDKSDLIFKDVKIQ